MTPTLFMILSVTLSLSFDLLLFSFPQADLSKGALSHIARFDGC